MSLAVRPPDSEAFRPYGAFIGGPSMVGERAFFSEWLAPVPGLTQQCHVNRVAPSSLPLTLDRVEQHPVASQLFLPIGVSRYLVTVMPAKDGGAPDVARALAFVVPGTLGVVYRPKVWHAGISVLDREGSFAVFMWRGGEEDDVFASIPPVELQPAERADPATAGVEDPT